MSKRIVIIPSSEGEEGNLIFFAPDGKDTDAVRENVDRAIEHANDDNGARSDEVIEFLEKNGYEFIGNPGTEQVIVTRPWTPEAVVIDGRKKELLTSIGFEILWSDFKRPYWQYVDNASEDFDTEGEAWAAAWESASEMAKKKHSLTSLQWQALGFEKQKQSILDTPPFSSPRNRNKARR